MNRLLRSACALCALVVSTTACDELEDLATDAVTTDVTVHLMEVDPVTGAFTSRSAPPGEPVIPLPPVVLPNGDVAFFGVTDGEDVGVDNMVLIYDPVADTWRRGADWPNLRTRHEWVELDGKTCAADGFVPGPKLLHILECYDVATDAWSTLTAPSIWSTEIVVDGDDLYAFDGDRSLEADDMTTNAAVFDSLAGSWRAIADKPACTASDAIAHAGSIFLFGCEPDRSGMAVYDIAADSWTAPIDIGEEVGANSIYRETATLGDKLYLADGRLLEVDPATGGSRTLRPDGVTSVATLAPIDGRLVMATNDFASSTVWLFDSATDTWTEGDTLMLPNLFAETRVVETGGRVLMFAMEVESVGVGL